MTDKKSDPKEKSLENVAHDRRGSDCRGSDSEDSDRRGSDRRGGDRKESLSDSGAALKDSFEDKEVGGPTAPDPTRYGDWERKGRCIDF